MINKLIDQIGGRERLEFIAENSISRERIIMARALLAVLDAKPVAFTDDEGLRNVKNGTFGEMFNGDYIDKFDGQWLGVYLTPPAASVPDGWKLVPTQPTQRMIDAHTEGMANGGATRAYRDMLAAAPAPGGDDVKQG